MKTYPKPYRTIRSYTRTLKKLIKCELSLLAVRLGYFTANTPPSQIVTLFGHNQEEDEWWG